MNNSEDLEYIDELLDREDYLDFVEEQADGWISNHVGYLSEWSLINEDDS